MNILFHNDIECVPEYGGIERVTSIIGMELKRRGHKVYSSYTVPVEMNVPRPEFDGYINLNGYGSEKVAALINEKRIDFIMVQKAFRDLPWMRESVNLSGRNVKIVYCLHSTPKKTKGLRGFKDLVLNDSSKRNLIKIPLKVLLHPIRKRQYDYQQYKWPAKYADHTLVLSEQYINPWLELSDGLGRDTLSAMPNPLSFDPHITAEDIVAKKKKVLIVARMEERQKNLKEALRVWKLIQTHTDIRDWTLEIVGNGPHRQVVEREAKRLEVPNVTFHGYQNPQPYLEECSIFMMTSRFEGWPMTINEAMQYGCVPVVYSSFSAIYDVITDGLDGYLIEPFKTEEYVKRMLSLMRSKENRESMAKEAVKSSQRFGLNPIVDRWEELLKKI